MAVSEAPSVMPLVLRGSLITLKRKCGRPRCRCAQGDLHETPALSLNVGGKTTIVTLRPKEIPEIRAALERYHEARARLDQQVRAAVALLQERHRRGPVKKGGPSSRRR
jgi:uncharacterized protein DUF6788